METPSFTRGVTRSQTLASASSANNANIPSSRKVEESVQKSGKKQQQDRSALIDITNDSPIVGLAMGSLKTPSSAVSKKRISNQAHFSRTPGSGEALLRGQVKTLLQKVEEEAELSKITLENRPLFNLQGLITSPINLVAPTPANTPQVFSLSVNGDALPSLSRSPVPETFLIPQMLSGMFDEKKQDSVESESESIITRALFLDFSEKSDSSDCSSVVTCQGVISGEREKVSTEDDDDSSVWSMQVNASSTRDEDEEEEVEGCIEEEEEEGEEEFGDNGWIDDVCEGMRKISVGPKFEGKHVRFIYNSDSEIEEEEEVGFQTPKQQ